MSHTFRIRLSHRSPLAPAFPTLQHARSYRAAILIASLAWGGAALAQSSDAPAPASAVTSGSGGDTNVVKLTPTTVVGKLDVAREQILPELGATVYTIDQSQIQALP